MARSIRIQYEGAFYHVMARGNRREAIFLDDEDRRFFLKTLWEACERTGWRIHAWVLMGNHYHLFVETPGANLVEGMKWLQNTFTRRFNVRHGMWGRLFGDRYKSVLVEGTKGAYYEALLDYIHLNASRAGLVHAAQGQSVLDYPWSSVAGGYGLRPEKRPKWLAAEDGLASLGLADTVKGRREFVERLDGRALEEGAASGIPPTNAEADARMSHLRRGWYWGSQEFAVRTLKIAGKLIGKGRSRAYAGTKERQAHAEQAAEELIARGLRLAGLTPRALAQSKGSDPRKVALAKLTWEKTTVSQGWIAARLGMASAANVGWLLHKTDWKVLERRLGAALCTYLHTELAH